MKIAVFPLKIVKALRPKVKGCKDIRRKDREAAHSEPADIRRGASALRKQKRRAAKAIDHALTFEISGAYLSQDFRQMTHDLIMNAPL